ncbi:MAG: efflux RND transporter periplasmic adaptor subunit [Lysobacter sp.]|nr:efflux RND transporter periplasmic adaptor subunit [Lysobacter sp.]
MELDANIRRIADTSGQDRPLRPQAMSSKRYGWAAAGALLVLASTAWAVASFGSSDRSIDASRLRIGEVARGDLIRDISAEGRVIAANSPTLHAVASGAIALKVVAGDRVSKGQELARIDSPELRSRLAQEESTLAGIQAESSRAELDVMLAQSGAQKVLDQARADHTAALRDVERYQRAYDGGAVSKNELDKAQDDLKKAEVALAAAKKDFALQVRGASIDARNKHLHEQRQRAVLVEVRRQVDALTLRAPFDGQVGRIHAPQGTNVAADSPLMSVIDLNVLEVEIRVPESFARDIGIGMPARISSADNEYGAEVSAVSPEVVNGEVTARLRFAASARPAELRQNQRLSVKIVLDTRKDALVVERGPFLEQDPRHVWVVEGDVLVRRPVELGVSSLSQVEIVSGLRPGQRIVVSRLEGVADRDRIKIAGAMK